MAAESGALSELERYVLDLPVDEAGYTSSFTLQQGKEALKFFNTYGVVVFREVLSAERCLATIKELLEYTKYRAYLPPEYRPTPEEAVFNPSDTDTWTLEHWAGLHRHGIVGSEIVAWSEAMRNRTHPGVLAAHAIIHGTDALTVNGDRYALFAPTVRRLKDGPLNSLDGLDLHGLEARDWGPSEDTPERRTTTNIHLDMNPWAYSCRSAIIQQAGLVEGDPSAELLFPQPPSYEDVKDLLLENNAIGFEGDGKLHTQSQINLLDNRTDDGGFYILPGLHRHFRELALATFSTLYPKFGSRTSFIPLTIEDFPLTGRAQRVTSRAGSVIIWSQLCPHGSAANTSNRPRFAQLLKALPWRYIEPSVLARRAALWLKLLADTLENSTYLEEATARDAAVLLGDASAAPEWRKLRTTRTKELHPKNRCLIM